MLENIAIWLTACGYMAVVVAFAIGCLLAVQWLNKSFEDWINR